MCFGRKKLDFWLIAKDFNRPTSLTKNKKKTILLEIKTGRMKIITKVYRVKVICRWCWSIPSAWAILSVTYAKRSSPKRDKNRKVVFGLYVKGRIDCVLPTFMTSLWRLALKEQFNEKCSYYYVQNHISKRFNQRAVIMKKRNALVGNWKKRREKRVECWKNVSFSVVG